MVTIEILILALLILVNGFFAMSEIAVVSARKTRLQQQAEEGNKRALAALQLANAPDQFLATIQIGITLVGILAGAFGGATVARELAGALEPFPLLAPYRGAISVGVVVVTITYLSLVFGELVPKRLALNSAEHVAAGVAPLMAGLSRLAALPVRLLSLSTGLVLRLLRATPEPEAPISEEEIKLLLRHGTQAGVFEPGEQEMVEQVFRLDDVTLSALMTPRPEVIWIDLDAPAEETRRLVATAGHLRFPVARGDLDQALGLVYTKDLLAYSLEGQPLDLAAALRPPLFLPESISALEAVQRLKEAPADAALVINEHGGVEGLITVTDVLKPIVGPIAEAGRGLESLTVQGTDGSWLLDGTLPVGQVQEILKLEALPEEGKSHYQTLGGLVLLCLGRIPAAGDHFSCCGWRFEVIAMDGRRVDKVRALAEEGDTAPA
jgi:putative hemolysin